jgi:hypothetical protein
MILDSRVLANQSGKIGVPARGSGALTVQDLERQQEEALPKEDLSPFAGQWVALRDGRVVASDVSGVALRNNPAVEENDVLVPVPSGRGPLIL